MEPWQSWALTLVLGTAAYYYYSLSTRKNAVRPARAASFSEDTPVRTTRKRDEPKPKRKPDTANKKKEQEAVNKAPAMVSQQAVDEEQDQDKQWAHQLAGLKKGTSLAPPERNNARSKTVKQRTADVDRGLTSGSSTNDADADAETSPAHSPALNAAAGGVADMLEAAAPGPSVLRLTEPTNPVAQKKTQKKAAPEPKETKKQRQNRKKVEQEKAIRDEAEQARRVQLEQQRRTAREARGEPAKNGIGAAPASNAWTAKKETTSNGDGPLLDTFEPKATNSRPSAPTGTIWERDLPSEEEQMRLAMADSGWNTVEKGKKGKKKTANAEPESVSAKEAPEVQSLPLTDTSNTSRSNTMSTDNDVKPNGLGASAVNVDYMRGDIGSHPQDSDWAVV
ncbi:hypothetical protein IWX90DRAFT_385917 [Phyllosticta citrichinensis]|uniref:Uncharacterized protein n=1 Tax=Phyllosticta citrichinensis TaxID=1130410 RepID=A0ABR1XUA9_9PEZI